ALLERTGFTSSDLKGGLLVKLISMEFYQDLVIRKRLVSEFQNYRAYLRTQNNEKILVQVSGVETDQGWDIMMQELLLPQGLEIAVGPFVENVKSSQLLRRYVSKQTVARVQSAVRQGLDSVPDEERDMTFLFADLVAFTSLSERTEPAEIIEMLNLSIGATSTTVLHCNGFVDKIMGDSIFAVFEKTENAIQAAIEIQKQFSLLNLFRIKNGQDEVLLRVGINSGKALMASIGSQEFFELTFIGDAVNTASRLEKACMPGSILVSASAIEPLGDSVHVVETVEINVKGKKDLLKASYVNRIAVDGPRGRMELALDEGFF
ncbi:MAG: adenylate/guanylate cyclase domain-containing protein, partial [Spirochaetia bacterium]|nr:adenylate/guanylate cyclase domain-containing protein [Spirochaetia bacterium]